MAVEGELGTEIGSFRLAYGVQMLEGEVVRL